MAAFVKYYCSVEDIAEGVTDFDADTFKLALTNTSPTLTHTALADITEITAGNGYSSGGATVSMVSSSQSTGTYKWVVSDVTVTASGGNIGPFRWVVLRNSTDDRNVGYWDIGAETTITSGNTWTADFDATNGAIQVV